jgi:regulatory protein
MSVRSSRATKKPPSGDSLYEIAIRALARRARSVGELRLLLERRQGEKQDIEAVLQRLREQGYLDDARFARSFVASRIENERFGRRRVRQDLAARRVHPELIQQALHSGYADVDERQLLRDYLRRKLRLSRAPQKPSAVSSLYRRLLRAGFSSDTIVKELQGLLQGQRRGARRGSREIEPEKWREWLELLSEVPEPGTESD